MAASQPYYSKDKSGWGMRDGSVCTRACVCARWATGSVADVPWKSLFVRKVLRPSGSILIGRFGQSSLMCHLLSGLRVRSTSLSQSLLSLSLSISVTRSRCLLTDDIGPCLSHLVCNASSIRKSIDVAMTKSA